jgi:hypothetical protein
MSLMPAYAPASAMRGERQRRLDGIAKNRLQYSVADPCQSDNLRNCRLLGRRMPFEPFNRRGSIMLFDGTVAKQAGPTATFQYSGHWELTCIN